MHKTPHRTPVRRLVLVRSGAPAPGSVRRLILARPEDALLPAARRQAPAQGVRAP